MYKLYLLAHITHVVVYEQAYSTSNGLLKLYSLKLIFMGINEHIIMNRLLRLAQNFHSASIFVHGLSHKSTKCYFVIKNFDINVKTKFSVC